MICFDFQFFSIFEIAISNVMYNYHSNDFTNYGVIRLLFMSFNFSCFSVAKTCGESASTNCTYFQNRGYPTTFNAIASCQLNVNKCATNVCQLR